MTKEEAYAKLSAEYTEYEPRGLNYVPALCNNLPEELKKDWQEHWDFINAQENKYTIPAYIPPCEDYSVIASLTRLLSLCIFIEDTYE